MKCLRQFGFDSLQKALDWLLLLSGVSILLSGRTLYRFLVYSNELLKLLDIAFQNIEGDLGASVLSKLSGTRNVESIAVRASSHRVHYQEACRYWAKSSTFSPRFIRNGEQVDQPHGRIISLENKLAAGFVNCLLNSSLFYWYYSTLADCEHINDSLVKGFPLPKNWEATDWESLSSLIDKALRSSASSKSITTKQGHVIEYDEIDGKRARDVILRADIALGNGFGFAQAELDYVVNYDIKYRVGQSNEATDD